MVREIILLCSPCANGNCGACLYPTKCPHKWSWKHILAHYPDINEKGAVVVV